MPKVIDPEMKARAGRLVVEHQQEYASLNAAAGAVAKQLGWAMKRSAAGWSSPRSTRASGRARPVSPLEFETTHYATLNPEPQPA